MLTEPKLELVGIIVKNVDASFRKEHLVTVQPDKNAH